MGRRSSHDDESRYSQSFAEALGRTIKVLRTDLGVERRELAERAGISYSYLTEIENGNKPPSSSVLGPIAEALGLRMFELTEAAEGRMEAQGIRTESLGARMEAQAAQPAAASAPGSAATSPSGEPADQVELFLCDAPSRLRSVEYSSMRPSLRGVNRDLRATIIELERLVRGMAPEDVERLVDFARRLAR